MVLLKLCVYIPVTSIFYSYISRNYKIALRALFVRITFFFPSLYLTTIITILGGLLFATGEDAIGGSIKTSLKTQPQRIIEVVLAFIPRAGYLILSLSAGRDPLSTKDTSGGISWGERGKNEDGNCQYAEKQLRVRTLNLVYIKRKWNKTLLEMEMGQTHFLLPCSWCRDFRTGVWSPLETGRIRGPVPGGEREGNQFTVSHTQQNCCYPLGLTKLWAWPPSPSSALGGWRKLWYQVIPERLLNLYPARSHPMLLYVNAISENQYLPRVHIEQKFPAERLTLYNFIWTVYHEIWI